MNEKTFDVVSLIALFAMCVLNAIISGGKPLSLIAVAVTAFAAGVVFISITRN